VSPREPASVAGRPGTADVRKLRAPLLRWYRRVKRDLPWRRTNDPYAIWVSEIMLQQTQVATVIPYYERFLELFPDVRALAQADEETVLGAWSGLGYYRRARSLHAAARAVVDEHEGLVPRAPDALRSLPGIGRYTAGAVASIAFDQPEPILDGNVRRILSRLFAIDAADAGRGHEERLCWDVAGTLVDGPSPGDLNQALMELGATVCSPTNPDCHGCPVRRHCRASALGEPERFPAPQPKREPESVSVAVAWIARGDRVLLERPGDDNPLRGTWDLPATEIRPGDDPTTRIAATLAQRHGLSITVGDRTSRHTHGIMHRRLTLDVHACKLARGSVAGRGDLQWAPAADLAGIAISGATKKIARGNASGGAPARRSTPRALPPR
jgi:A/G-specific adenine glycosylase